MQRIEVIGVRFHARHGCHAEERRVGGVFETDIVIDADLETAAESDKLIDTIDYVDLMALIEEEMDVRRDLIETVAQSIAEQVLKRFSQAQKVEVKVKKLSVPVRYNLDHVAVSTYLERPAK